MKLRLIGSALLLDGIIIAELIEGLNDVQARRLREKIHIIDITNDALACAIDLWQEGKDAGEFLFQLKTEPAEAAKVLTEWYIKQER